MAKAGRQTKTMETAPAAEVQQAQNAPEWLRPYVAEFRLLGRLWAGDATVTEDQVRSAFAAKLASDNGKHKGPIDGAVNQLVVLHGKPMSAFGLAFGEDNNARRVKKAEQAITCATEAGYPMLGWNKPAALRLIAEWEKKHDEQTASEPSNVDETNLLALLSLPTGSPAQIRFPEFYEWAHSDSFDPNKPQRQAVDSGVIDISMKDARLEADIAELEARLAIVSDPKNPAKDYEEAGVLDAKINDLKAQRAALKGKVEESKPKVVVAAKTPTVQDRITTTETQLAKAKTDKIEATANDNDEAYATANAEFKRLQGELATLRTQMETETAARVKEQPAPKATAPTVSKSGNGKMTFEQAKSVCQAPDAVKRHKTAWGRYLNEEIDQNGLVEIIEATT